MRLNTLFVLASAMLTHEALAAMLPVGKWPSVASDFNLGMKTLLLHNVTNGDLPSMVMDGYSTPYVRAETLPNLADPDYQAIVVSRPVDDGELRKMRDYCVKYGVRIVYLNAQVRCSL